MASSARAARRGLLPIFLVLTLLVSLASAQGSDEGSPSLESPPDTVCTRRREGDRICPELFILGVQKGGSSSIWVWLWQNYGNDILLSNAVENWRKKEVHYFDLKFRYGTNWYANHFDYRNTSNDLAMDGTPCYSRYWQAPERMKMSLPAPRLRFVLSFRDPVRRAYSWYRHVMVDFMGPRDGYVEAYDSFDRSFKHMADFSEPVITACMKRHKPSDVHRFCAFNDLYYKKYRAIIPATGRSTKKLNAVAMLFTDGLYGYILIHWFRYFEPSQFCMLFYETLTADFHSEMKHMEPCLTAFNRPLKLTPESTLPWVNSKHCTTCETLSDHEMKAIGKKLHDRLFLSSNQILRQIIKTFYNRDAPVVWEDAYRDTLGE